MGEDCNFSLLYVMLALGLNIVIGFAGLLDLGYVAFYAVGAYLFALLSSSDDCSISSSMPFQMVYFLVDPFHLLRRPRGFFGLIISFSLATSR